MEIDLDFTETINKFDDWFNLNNNIKLYKFNYKNKNKI